MSRWLAGALLFLWAIPARAQVDVWIDTDPSIGMAFRDADDGFALIEAFRSPELRIRGISATYGNASLDRTARIAHDLAARFGADAGIGAQDVSPGASGAEDLGRPTAATTALAAALEERRLTYLALGPLTNLGTLLKLRPELASRIDRVIFLGGRVPGERLYLGHWLPYEFHDANFEKDPFAALTVLRAPVALAFVPMNASRDVLFTPDDTARLGREGGAAGRYLEENTGPWLRSWRWLFGLEGGPAFDALAVLAVTHPEEIAGREMTACVSGSLDHAQPTALDEAGKQPFLLVFPVSSDNVSARKVTFLSSPKTSAKAKILDTLLGRAAPMPSNVPGS